MDDFARISEAARPGGLEAVLASNPSRHGASRLRSYKAALHRQQRTLLLAGAVFVGGILLASKMTEVDLAQLVGKIGGITSYADRLLTLDNGARVWTDLPEWFWGWQRWLRLLGETVLMAYMGTLAGVAGAFVLCFPASRNLRQNRLIQIGVRRLLEFCRTVPEIVFALIFVVAFGFGALPGILALAIHTTGALGKTFFEAVETIDMRTLEGLDASGATRLQTIRFAVVPQVLPLFVSYSLLRFEINVRSATVLGFVGAGGIGQELLVAIRRFFNSDVSAMLVMIALAVFAIDIATGYLRRYFISGALR